jgi:uncharacterized membrane protein
LVRLVLVVVGALASVVVFVVSVNQQQWTWRVMGLTGPERSLYVGVLVITWVICFVAAQVVRGVRWLHRRLDRLGRSLLPSWLAGVLSVIVAFLIIFTFVNDVVYKGAISYLNARYAHDDVVLDGSDPPAPFSSLESGGPGSLVSWSSLGEEGRRFIARVPTAAQISELSGQPAVAPIRVFVGLSSAPTLHARVGLAMRELERTGAFARRAVVLNIPTGTGWMDEQTIEPAEYFLGGDVATVGLQYSHLPSPIAFVAERQAAVQSAVAMYRAIHHHLRAMPAAQRPELLMTGESLGAYGGQGVFRGLHAMTAGVAHALWVGTPASTDLRQDAEEARRPGSLQMFPVVGNGRAIVFAENGAGLAGTDPRVVYLQHADDPMVWWDTNLILHKPDWMKEPIDPSINPSIRWVPIATFLQVTVDMATSNSFDEGYGHRYGSLPTVAWARMLQPRGWTPARITALRARLDSL